MPQSCLCCIYLVGCFWRSWKPIRKISFLHFGWVLLKMSLVVFIQTCRASSHNQWNQSKSIGPCVWSWILEPTCVVHKTNNNNLWAEKLMALSHNQCFMVRLHNSLWSHPISWIFIEQVPAQLFTHPLVCKETHSSGFVPIGILLWMPFSASRVHDNRWI